jgi:hypothetical protein
MSVYKIARVRAMVLTAVAAVAASGLAALVPATAAHAAGLFQTALSVQIGYTDSVDHRTAFPWTQGVHLPLGASTGEDGKIHKSRVYATYDLSAFVGKHVLGGTVRVREQSAADCTKRAIELWQTRTVSRTPSWDSAPSEQTKLDEILTPEFCPTANISFDVLPAITEALDRGRTQVTFELRVPAALEAQPAYGRTLNWSTSVSLSVNYNTAPTVTVKHLYNDYLACDRSAPYTFLGSWSRACRRCSTTPTRAPASRVSSPSGRPMTRASAPS